MFSSLDLLSRNKEVYTVWHTGISNASLSKEQVFNTNLKNIAKEIIENDENMAFRLSAIVMKGAVVIYSKQTTYVLTDCNNAIEKISLRYDGKKRKNETNEANNNAQNNVQQGIDDETMAIWEHAEIFQPTDGQLFTARNEDNNGDNDEVRDGILENENISGRAQESNEENDEIEEGGDLGGALNFDLSDDNEDNQNHQNPIDDVAIPMPSSSDNDENQNDEIHPEVDTTKSKKLVIDPKPLMSLNMFMEKLKESFINFEANRRKANAPKNGILIIADEIDHLFQEAYDSRTNYIGYMHVNPVEDENDNPNIAGAMESDLYIPENDEDNVSENENDKNDSSLLDLLPEIEEALKERETVTFNEITATFDLEQIAKAFYTTLALCNEGKIDMFQKDPYDMIYLKANE